MRICFVVDYYPPHIGGGEMYISKLAEGLASRGDACVVVTMKTELSTPRIEKKGNLRIVRIGNPSRAGRAFFTFLAIPHVIAQAKKCDIIQAASYGGAIPAFVAATLLKKKCIFIVYEFMGALWKRLEPNWFKATFYRFVEKIIAVLPFHKFVANSRCTRHCLKSIGIESSKLEVVYGGQNVELLQGRADRKNARKELGLTGEDFVFLAYGRAGITKGMEYFVDAIPLIRRKIPQARFVLILTRSDPRIWDHVQRTLSSLPADSYRFFPGLPYQRLVENLSASDCIVIPSLSDGFGFCVLEACTFVKRVVATDAGSIPEVIFGSHIMVQPGSSELLAEACWRAYQGKMDYLPPKTFRWEDTINRFRRIYEEALGRAGVHSSC
ncbi:MAG: glycosyltransferase family 4 protein [Candidatus Aminicenantales bacterium]